MCKDINNQVVKAVEQCDLEQIKLLIKELIFIFLTISQFVIMKCVL